MCHPPTNSPSTLFLILTALKRGKSGFWAIFLSLKDLYDLILHIMKVLNCLSYVCMVSLFLFFISFCWLFCHFSFSFLFFRFSSVFFFFFFLSTFLFSSFSSFLFYLSYFLFPKSGGPSSLYLSGMKSGLSKGLFLWKEILLLFLATMSLKSWFFKIFGKSTPRICFKLQTWTGNHVF